MDFTGSYVSAIIRRFEFSSALQRMSVICKNQIDGKFRSFVKGSPELIGTLCLSESIPQNYKEILDNYTKEGYRVIALATKELKDGFNYRKSQTIERNFVES
jgi:cation-transporting ATPase 13A3/4/5